MFYQHNMGAGGWILMALANIVIWGLIIAFIVWLARDLRTRPHRHHIPQAHRHARSSIVAWPAARSAPTNTTSCARHSPQTLATHRARQEAQPKPNDARHGLARIEPVLSRYLRRSASRAMTLWSET